MNRKYNSLILLCLAIFYWVVFFAFETLHSVDWVLAHPYVGLVIGMIAVTLPFVGIFRDFCEDIIEEAEDLFRAIADAIVKI